MEMERGGQSMGAVVYNVNSFYTDRFQIKPEGGIRREREEGRGFLTKVTNCRRGSIGRYRRRIF